MHICSLMPISPSPPLPLPLQLDSRYDMCIKPPSSPCRLLCRIPVTFSPTLCASFLLLLSSCSRARFHPSQLLARLYVRKPAASITLADARPYLYALPQHWTCGSRHHLRRSTLADYLWGRRVVMIRISQGEFSRRERKRKGGRVS